MDSLIQSSPRGALAAARRWCYAEGATSGFTGAPITEDDCMLETLGFVAFLLAVLFVVMAPKPSAKEDEDSDSAGK
jgi:hypothetical protein